MLKKLVIVGIIGFVAVSAVKGSKFGSYIRSEFNSWCDRAEANIPPEKELQRLRNEVKLLDKDIRNVIDHLAKERVAVDQLKEKTAELRARQSKDKELLNARAAAIKGATV
jgi:peptidoglycan hydrolase CwlO-like protein